MTYLIYTSGLIISIFLIYKSAKSLLKIEDRLFIRHDSIPEFKDKSGLSHCLKEDKQ